MKKSLNQKREEAMERFKASKWEDSKACRTGSRTQEQWQKWKDKVLNK